AGALGHLDPAVPEVDAESHLVLVCDTVVDHEHLGDPRERADGAARYGERPAVAPHDGRPRPEGAAAAAPRAARAARITGARAGHGLGRRAAGRACCWRPTRGSLPLGGCRGGGRRAWCAPPVPPPARAPHARAPRPGT